MAGGKEREEVRVEANLRGWWEKCEVKGGGGEGGLQ